MTTTNKWKFMLNTLIDCDFKSDDDCNANLFTWFSMLEKRNGKIEIEISENGFAFIHVSSKKKSIQHQHGLRAV